MTEIDGGGHVGCSWGGVDVVDAVVEGKNGKIGRQ